jgi:hypothetical protein
MKRKLPTYYSGKNSRPFWNRIAKLKDSDNSAVYMAGVILQNLEGWVLNQLQIREGKQ